MGWEVWFARMCRKGSPSRSNSVSTSLPPPITTGSPPPESPLLLSAAAPATPPFPLLPLHPTFSSPALKVGAFGAGWCCGGDLWPPCSRTPSSHVLGRSARPPGRATAVAVAAEPPARAVSVPGTRQGGEEKPGEAEGWRCEAGTELRLPTLQPPRCPVPTYL